MDDSPLGRLPRELREYIYVLALTKSCNIRLQEIEHHTTLTQTCRQARTEGLPIFFAVNNFYDKLRDDEWYQKHSFGSVLKSLGGDIVARMGNLTLWNGDDTCEYYKFVLVPSPADAHSRDGHLMHRERYRTQAMQSLMDVYEELGLCTRVWGLGSEGDDTIRKSIRLNPLLPMERFFLALEGLGVEIVSQINGDPAYVSPSGGHNIIIRPGVADDRTKQGEEFRRHVHGRSGHCVPVILRAYGALGLILVEDPEGMWVHCAHGGWSQRRLRVLKRSDYEA
ncbi:hypothetical protein LTR86_010258 [Recurvomyces mirabilis]|nr:hypothetical protein LTR86_010258 [Recurvomyces mirabilis]